MHTCRTLEFRFLEDRPFGQPMGQIRLSRIEANTNRDIRSQEPQAFTRGSALLEAWARRVDGSMEAARIRRQRYGHRDVWNAEEAPARQQVIAIPPVMQN